MITIRAKKSTLRWAPIALLIVVGLALGTAIPVLAGPQGPKNVGRGPQFAPWASKNRKALVRHQTS